MAKIICYGEEARKALEKGVNQLADTCLLYTSGSRSWYRSVSKAKRAPFVPIPVSALSNCWGEMCIRDSIDTPFPRS